MSFEISEDILESAVVVSVQDDCIDVEASNVEKYVRTLDESHLVFNGEPTRFRIKPLSPKEYDACMLRVDKNKEGMVRVFHRGCVEVMGIKVKRGGVVKEIKTRGSSELAHRIPLLVRQEIGMYIVRMTHGYDPEGEPEQDLGKP